MPSTVMTYAGKLYHKACLDPGEIIDATEIAAAEFEDDEVCDECMEPLRGEAAPDDVDKTADDEPEAP